MNRRLYVFMLAAVMAAALGLGGCMAGDGKKEENEKDIFVYIILSFRMQHVGLRLSASCER